MLGRLASEQNPEAKNTAFIYTYETDATCGTSNGDLAKWADAFPNPNTNVTCYAYDSLHRLTDVTYPSGSYASVTAQKHFVYDAATVNSVVMSNPKARLAEAYTGASASKISDLGFSYSARGEAMDVYQSTPNSGSYYHVSATYWENGLIKTLSGVGLPALTYDNPDGEGRPYAFFEGTSTYRVTSAAYDLFGLPTGINFTSGDSDSFTNDPNTGRMTQYKLNVGSPVQSVIGNLTWNQNGSVGTLGITDPFNSLNQQTCAYGYEIDMPRISSANCGSIWNETFSYSDGGQGTGAFGNLTKTGISGATSFQPTYNTATNRITSVGSQNYTYDANGNMTSTGTGTGTSAYTWDAEGKMLSDAPNGSTTVNVTYDALGRVVEQARRSSYTQIVYGPQGNKLALMSGQTLTKAFVPLPGGATAVYNSSGLSYYRHADWLGSSRFASTPARGMYYDGAYAPYGENYAEAGTTDRSFTGQNQDTTSDIYDFLFREHHPTQGRWISPDPLAGSIYNPQSLNRYAYVGNNPTNATDPLGLCDPLATYGCGKGQLAMARGLAEYGTGSGPYSSPTCTIEGEPWPCGLASNLLQGGGDRKSVV